MKMGEEREDNGTWRKVDGGRSSRRGIGRENYHLSTPGNNTQRKRQSLDEGIRDSRKKAGLTRRPPKSAAVMIVGEGEEFSYAEALKKTRSKISLDELRIESTKIRKAANGGMLIKVLGPDGSSKANGSCGSASGCAAGECKNY